MNTKLPFFSYGIFRPGEIPFIGIIDFIDKVEKLTIKGNIKIRDGVYLFAEGKNDVDGFLIYFKPNMYENAYDFINGLEPNKIFSWSEKTDKNSNPFNLLIGRSPDKGSQPIKELQEDVKHRRGEIQILGSKLNTPVIDDFSTTKDPYFTTGLEMLREFKFPETTLGFKGSFKIQMNYMFLWIIIERFTFLRYSLGGNPNLRIQSLAKNEYFILGLEKYVTSERDGAKIFNTNTLEHRILNKNEPKKALDYYYQIRSNLTHRGKGIYRDFSILKDSYKELLEITVFVITNTIDECQKNKEKYGRKD